MLRILRFLRVFSKKIALFVHFGKFDKFPPRKHWAPGKTLENDT